MSLRRRPAARFLLHPLALAACLAGTAQAQSDETATIVVTGSMRQQKLLDAPFAIGVVDAQAIRDGGPMINLSEAMARVPGLVVANRNNYAQDLQISSRGFGARAGFGVRGLRMYTDGIPATMPDGQGQVGHFDLSGAQRIEVLRGPFSVLYGASSGGVIALYTAPATERSVELEGDIGSFGLHQARFSVAAPLGNGFDLRANLQKMEIDGFRPQSSADRQLANLRLGWQGEADTVTAWLSNQDQAAQDPLGLKPEDFAANPRGTTPEATQYDTRKTIRQTQLGVNWRHRFGETGVLRETSLTGYYGSRGVTQYLAIPPTTQRSALVSSQRHGGGVVDFDRIYSGTEARATLALGRVDVVAGLAWDRAEDDRRGYENFLGDPTAPTALGVKGLPRRDETDTATTRDGFVQASTDITSALNATLGVRSGRMRASVADRYIQGANIDDSGAVEYSYTNPVLGLRYTLQPGWTLHASMARGYETPTLGELAYTATNSGFNFDLKGQTSRQFELGTKWRSRELWLDAMLFQVNTDDEIGVFSNSGGRSSFRNVGRTERYGAEFGGTWFATPALRASWSLSVLHAAYRDSFQTCTVNGCPTPNPTATVDAGNRIAGTQKGLAWAELAWKPGVVPGEFAAEVRGQSKTAANDVNTVFAPGFGIVNLRWSHGWKLGDAGELQTLLRVDNAFDRAYVGSVIVNDANSRFFEPGAPRNYLVALRWLKKF